MHEQLLMGPYSKEWTHHQHYLETRLWVRNKLPQVREEVGTFTEQILLPKFLPLLRDDETTISVSGWITEQLLNIHKAKWEVMKNLASFLYRHHFSVENRTLPSWMSPLPSPSLSFPHPLYFSVKTRFRRQWECLSWLLMVLLCKHPSQT